MAGVIGLLAAAPVHLGGGSALGLSLSRIVLALILCSGLAIAVAVLLKRGGGRIDLAGWRPVGPIRAGRRIDVIESRRISPHADICLLRCDGRDYLILSSAVAQQVLRQGPAA